MFPERLKQLRKSRNVNQQTLGEYLDYKYTTIGNYETGRNEPSLDVLIKIAQFFDVSVDYLIGASDFPISEKEITEKEMELLYAYRGSDENNQKALSELINVLSKF